MDKLTDVSWWQSIAQALGPLGWAGIFCILTCLFLPMTLEYGLADEWRNDKRLPLYSFFGSIVLGILVALLVAWPEWRYGLAIGIVGGAISHGVRMGLSQLRWFAWMRAKPKVDLVYDEKGNVRGAHVEGYDGTIITGRPPDKTLPGAKDGSA